MALLLMLASWAGMFRLHSLAQQADTRLDAAVPLYGVYDFLDHSGLNSNVFLRGLLNDKIMGCTPEQNPDLWQQAFDVMHSIRTDHMANHVSAFLEWSYANRPVTTVS